jgi:hypothetical protein
MRGQIVRTEIRFDLDDPAHTLHAAVDVHQALAEQLVRDDDRIAVVELAWKLMQSVLPPRGA